MSDIKRGLRAYYLQQPSVTAIVNTRIYPRILPQPCTMPAIVLREVSGLPEQDLVGDLGARVTQIQVDCYGDTDEAANRLREAVRKCFPPTYKGPAGEETIMDVEHENLYEREERPTTGSAAWRYIDSIDFVIWHEQLAAA